MLSNQNGSSRRIGPETLSCHLVVALAHVLAAGTYTPRLLLRRTNTQLGGFPRFFETEGIAIMTMLVSQYKIEVMDEPEFAAETFEERKARVLQAKQGLTLT